MFACLRTDGFAVFAILLTSYLYRTTIPLVIRLGFPLWRIPRSISADAILFWSGSSTPPNCRDALAYFKPVGSSVSLGLLEDQPRSLQASTYSLPSPPGYHTNQSVFGPREVL